MSKAFDVVWNDRLINKIKCVGMNGMLLKLRKIFFENRFQRVVLIVQSFSWEPVLAVVPPGSVLGPSFFLL